MPDGSERLAEVHAPAVSSADFKSAVGSFAAGVAVITTIDPAGEAHALTATAFSSVSLEPPLCLVCIDKRARTHGPVQLRGSFAVNILHSDQQTLSARFATRGADKFAGVAWRPGPTTGCPLLEEALAAMECQVVEVHWGGDHDIFLGKVASVRVSEGAPLVYWRGRYATLSGR